MQKNFVFGSVLIIFSEKVLMKMDAMFVINYIGRNAFFRFRFFDQEKNLMQKKCIKFTVKLK